MMKESVKNLCTLVRGSSPRPSGDPRYYGGSIPRLMVKDVSRDGMYVTPKIDFLTEEGAAKSRPMKKGDLVIAVSGDPGEPSILNVDACIHDGFVGLRELNTKKVFTPYLYRYFKFNKQQSKSQAVGAIYKNLNTNQIKALEIPLPPLDQQKKIAAILGAADAYRQKTKALIAKYEELIESLFLDMFGDPVTNPMGWEVFKGEKLCENISVGVVIKPASYYVDSGVLALRTLNIKPYRITFDEVVYFSEEAHRTKLKKSILRTGDVIVVRTGNTGTAAIIPEELDGVNCIDMIIVRANQSKLSPKYLCHFLNSERGKQLVSGKSVGGIQKHFNVGAMKKTNIPLPSINLQNQFAERVQAIEAQKAQAQASLSKAEDLFNSLLQKAFKGELT